MTTILEMRGITKRFHGVTALRDVNLAVISSGESKIPFFVAVIFQP